MNSETSCPEESILRSYLADGLDVDSTINLENHVEVCKKCENQLCEILESQSFAVLASPTTTNSETIPDHIEPNQPYSIRYECLSLLDVGGFGSVWKMLDKQFNRLVAVKVLKARHSKNSTLVRRFFAEAQICSQLSHPYIVPIHDMGMLNDGRPYFAMKLVEGKRLNEAFLKENAAEKPSQLIPRLRAFDYLCQAISFAHEHSIIHRDLKPQNIMVGQHGEVQVMDWGLAKHIGKPSQKKSNSGSTQLVADTVRQIRDQTQSGALGTFGYMAPEQARDAASATKRSDVFSLGAILYQLLTGEPPYSVDSFAENSTTTVERELERAIQNLVDFDVDSRLIDLITRCLQISPSNRPKNASVVSKRVGEFLNSVAEELENRKVEIAEQKLQVQENVKRRRLWGVLSGVLLVTAILIGAVGIGSYIMLSENNNQLSEAANRVRLEKENSDERYQLALKAIKAYHSTVSKDTLLRKPELSNLRKNLLSNGQRFYDELADQIGRSRQMSDKWQLALAVVDLADITADTGNLDDIIRIDQQAVDLLEEIHKELPDDVEKTTKLAHMYNELGYHQRQRGDFDLAIKNFTNAINTYQKLPTIHDALFNSRSNLANTFSQLERPVRAREIYQGSIDQIRRLDVDSDDMLEQLANVYGDFGIFEERLGNLEKGLELKQKSLSIDKRLAEENPNNDHYIKKLGTAHNNVGVSFYSIGNTQQSINHFNLAILEQRKLAEKHPGRTEYQLVLARSYGNLGVIQSGKEVDKSINAFVKANSILEQLIIANPKHRVAREYLGSYASGYGNVLMNLGRMNESLLQFKRALELKQQLFTENPKVLSIANGVASIQSSIARLEYWLNDTESAAKTCENAIQEFERQLSAAPNLSDAGYQYTLAVLEFYASSGQKRFGNREKAKQILLSAKDRLDENNYQQCKLLCDVLLGLGLLEEGEAAAENFERIKTIYRSRQFEQDITLASALVQLGEIKDGLKIVEELDAGRNDGAHLVDLAGIYCQVSRTFEDKKEIEGEGGTSSGQLYADNAFQMILQASKSGFFTETGMIERLKELEEFQPIADRLNAQQLLRFGESKN